MHDEKRQILIELAFTCTCNFLALICNCCILHPCSICVSTKQSALKVLFEHSSQSAQTERLTKWADVTNFEGILKAKRFSIAHLQWHIYSTKQFTLPNRKVCEMKTQFCAFKEAAKNITKTLDKFYARNTLSGRPSKMVLKHLEKHPFHLPDPEAQE